ncbi:MAG: hypothetical protein KC656_01925 [Myxococcales bacterium]|nr:hypothetical protein [Myxococcales bacterium]MCB9691552.1 hypothetical protein [Alphaproteobacteria bacterium]
MRALTTLLVCSTLLGCSDPELPGLYFDVSASLASDGCNQVPVGYSEDFAYRVRIEPGTTDAAVAIGPDEFAAGSISGCTFTYSSVVWTQERDAGDIRWILEGQAEIQRGDGSCGNAQDWLGTEAFVVQSSEDPTVQPGCRYEVTVVGSYVGEVTEE